MPDFNRFFEQVVAFVCYTRMMVAIQIATDETLARKVWNAHSAKARLRAIAFVLAAPYVNDPSEGPRIKVQA